MEFVKYQHVEKFGSDEVEGIQFGECYVFPKIDGTNASIWFDGASICCGSRNNVLTDTHDNAGFRKFVLSDDRYKRFFEENKNLRLYGEWLVPHTLKTYKEDAWRKFYVFDVLNESGEYLHYNEYKLILDRFGIDYIYPIAVITNGTDENYLKCIENNRFLIKENEGIGEGVVVKRYGFKNKYGRTKWAKIVTAEFKDKHCKEMGPPDIIGKLTFDCKFIEQCCTKALIEKEYSKIAIDGWDNRKIPRLLSTVFYCVVTECTWDFIKEHKYPNIDFKRAKMMCDEKIKTIMPHLFSK